MSAATATSPILERRREHRVSVRVPVVVRGTDRSGASFEERTTTENVCRGGAAFALRCSVSLGDCVEISVPGVPSKTPSKTSSKSEPDNKPDVEFSTHARIVHLYPGNDGQECTVGVEFTDFQRTCDSESTS